MLVVMSLTGGAEVVGRYSISYPACKIFRLTVTGFLHRKYIHMCISIAGTELMTGGYWGCAGLPVRETGLQGHQFCRQNLEAHLWNWKIMSPL